MGFDKRSFHKTLKRHFESNGYTMHKNRKHYFIDCNDGIVRLVVRIPDGKHGFEIGAQFADWKPMTGQMNHILVAWTVCDSILVNAAEHEYSSEQIEDGARAITDALAPYVWGGKELIRANMNDFYENDPARWAAPYREHNEVGANEAQHYFGFSPVEFYSNEYRAYTAKKLRDEWAVRTFSVPLNEYWEHKEYFDGFLALGCTVQPMEDIGSVWIRGRPYEIQQ